VPVTVSLAAADQSTGSLVFTNDATVDVTITVDPPEAVIVGWLITESDVEPTEGWLAEAPASCTIAGAEGTVTLHAWVIDDTDAIASASAGILFSTAVPQVLSRNIVDNGDGTVTATWTTDIPAEGGVKYGPVTMTGTTPNATPLEGAVGTDHSVSFAIAAGINYKVILVNNEADSPAFFWPSPWPIEGDANMDCRVNILDLIFIRNKLNLDVSTGDNWQADVNKDARINILDLIYVRNKLNTQCP